MDHREKPLTSKWMYWKQRGGEEENIQSTSEVREREEIQDIIDRPLSSNPRKATFRNQARRVLDQDEISAHGDYGTLHAYTTKDTDKGRRKRRVGRSLQLSSRESNQLQLQNVATLDGPASDSSSHIFPGAVRIPGSSPDEIRN